MHTRVVALPGVTLDISTPETHIYIYIHVYISRLPGSEYDALPALQNEGDNIYCQQEGGVVGMSKVMFQQLKSVHDIC